MAMQVYLKFGTDTVDFQAEGCVVMDGYYPQTPGSAEGRATEKFECHFTGTPVEAKELINTINRWFEIAREYALISSPYQAVWMYFAVDATETAYRARVYDGNVLLNGSLDHAWRQGRVRFSVALERDPFWEAADWVAVPMWNGNETSGPQTEPLRVYACGDEYGSPPNFRTYYTQINAEYVDGDLPGPVKLVMTPEAYINGLYIGQCVDRDELGFVNLLEETDDYTGGSKVLDTGCSGSYYKSLTLPTSWGSVLSGTFIIADFPNRYFRFIGRFFNAPPAGTWVKLRMISPAGVVAETTAVQLSTRLMQDLGVMRISPYQELLEHVYNLGFRLYAYNVGAGTLNLDCLMLLGQDSYAELGSDLTNKIDPTWPITEQWGERKSYIREGAGEEYLFFNRSFGNGIWLIPGFNQRLYFLMYYGATAPITTSMLVQCWYKPRKRAL